MRFICYCPLTLDSQRAGKDIHFSHFYKVCIIPLVYPSPGSFVDVRYNSYFYILLPLLVSGYPFIACAILSAVINLNFKKTLQGARLQPRNQNTMNVMFHVLKLVRLSTNENSCASIMFPSYSYVGASLNALHSPDKQCARRIQV